MLVLDARPTPAEASFSYAALGDLLDELVPPDGAVHAALPEPQREALDVALLRASAPDRSLEGAPVAAAVRTVLHRLAGTNPLVVIIDDRQWLDRASEDVLVRPDADFMVLQAAYRALARSYHAEGSTPDPGRMVEINRAWESVRTVESRAGYDKGRRTTAFPVRPDPARSAPRQPFDPWKYGTTAPRSGGEIVDFGRYAGWRIADLVRHDPDYLRWLSRHSSGVRFIEAIARYLPGEVGVGRRAGLVG